MPARRSAGRVRTRTPAPVPAPTRNHAHPSAPTCTLPATSYCYGVRRAAAADAERPRASAPHPPHAGRDGNVDQLSSFVLLFFTRLFASEEGVEALFGGGGRKARLPGAGRGGSTHRTGSAPQHGVLRGPGLILPVLACLSLRSLPFLRSPRALRRRSSRAQQCSARSRRADLAPDPWPLPTGHPSSRPKALSRSLFFCFLVLTRSHPISYPQHPRTHLHTHAGAFRTDRGPLPRLPGRLRPRQRALVGSVFDEQS